MDKSRSKIEAMFNSIAGKYDFLNHLLTFNSDKRWRKQIAKNILKFNLPHNRILDAASGTGDLTLQLLKLNPGSIESLDFSEKMLDVQREKISNDRVNIIQGDVTQMPYPDNEFDLVTVGFGVRNFADLDAGLSEMKRVLKSGGNLIVIENFNKQGFFITMLDKVYCGMLLPLVGNTVSGSEAYTYLFKSIKDFDTVEMFSARCKKLGFELFFKKNNLVGVVNTLYFKKL